ncbi:Uncharacterized protein BM_BM10329 [Brugia malayi]|uniref:Bm10329 n=1 Tax=Brugia malayi TaxID=6279 RepID=A0A0K0IMW1_BRUMA|nr:Uncharacterized protein BM_BM10329 [Brugia malayi]CRZ24823.1 Bm10329 [Brugia malayi]VIO92997.1 Uncharacterized protein BM_BM10329 [Brugia malayi]
MFNHRLTSFTLTITIVITIICNEAFILQCQNCRCIPDYCPQTSVPRSLCPCDGMQTPCSRAGTAVQAMFSGAVNVHHQQQPFVLTQAPLMKYFLIQQPVQPILTQIPGQFIVESQQQQQQQQTLSLLQQQILPQQVRIGGGMQRPSIPPVYLIRTIEQPGQVLRQVQQIPESMVSSQYMSTVQQVPIQQTQMMMVPSVQQTIPQTQQFIVPLQVPMQTVTLQVPVTMAEHCTPRINACPVGLPSVHAVTECDNVTDTTATRCITVEEARRLYTCLPHFNFDKLWDN